MVTTDIFDRATEQRAASIRGLRELAEFFEQHPSVPLPVLAGQNAFVNTKAELAALARMATWRKEYCGTWFVLVRQFSGDVSLHLNADRSVVCRKVVTGTKLVPAQPEREVEEVQWVCDEPLLAEVQ